jgi:hypothetical protein
MPGMGTMATGPDRARAVLFSAVPVPVPAQRAWPIWPSIPLTSAKAPPCLGRPNNSTDSGRLQPVLGSLPEHDEASTRAQHLWPVSELSEAQSSCQRQWWTRHADVLSRSSRRFRTGRALKPLHMDGARQRHDTGLLRRSVVQGFDGIGCGGPNARQSEDNALTREERLMAGGARPRRARHASSGQPALRRAGKAQPGGVSEPGDIAARAEKLTERFA